LHSDSKDSGKRRIKRDRAERQTKKLREIYFWRGDRKRRREEVGIDRGERRIERYTRGEREREREKEVFNSLQH